MGIFINAALLCACLLCCFANAFAQEVISLRGVVKDGYTGLPLEGASVVVAGTTSGAITDGERRFVINGLEKGHSTIIVSSIGYSSAELRHKTGIGGNVVEITLMPESTELNAVTHGRGEHHINVKRERPLPYRRAHGDMAVLHEARMTLSHAEIKNKPSMPLDRMASISIPSRMLFIHTSSSKGYAPHAKRRTLQIITNQVT